MSQLDKSRTHDHVQRVRNTSKLQKSSLFRGMVRTRGLQVSGFRKALKGWVAEFVGQEDAAFAFDEWFGDMNVVPAAFKIEQAGEGTWDTTVHVYELKRSALMPDWKVALYSVAADNDGPLFCLHIIDRYDREYVVENEHLECFWSWRMAGQEYVDEWWKLVRTDKTVPKSEQKRKWKAAYDALREMGVQI